jgi:hypothetical protein
MISGVMGFVLFFVIASLYNTPNAILAIKLSKISYINIDITKNLVLDAAEQIKSHRLIL